MGLRGVEEALLSPADTKGITLGLSGYKSVEGKAGNSTRKGMHEGVPSAGSAKL